MQGTKISDKSFGTLSSNGVTSENNTIHTLTLSSVQSFRGCLFTKGARTVAERCMQRGVGGKRYFPLFMFVKRQKGPLGQRVSANFVADCWFSMGKKNNKPGVFRNLQILIIKMTSLVTMKICTKREEVYKYDWLHLLVKIDNIGLLKLKLPLTSSLLQ